MLKSLGLIAIAFSLTACSTISSGDLDYSLSNIFSSVESALSMGIQHSSENHREFFSNPFLVKQDPEITKAGYRERGVARVLVLGDSRPYTIDVEVSIEQAKVKDSKKTSEYSHDHYDKELAKKLLHKIVSSLDRRQHDNNVIDDFKPF